LKDGENVYVEAALVNVYAVTESGRTLTADSGSDPLPLWRNVCMLYPSLQSTAYAFVFLVAWAKAFEETLPVLASDQG
jgi:hypothetical protein